MKRKQNYVPLLSLFYSRFITKETQRKTYNVKMNFSLFTINSNFLNINFKYILLPQLSAYWPRDIVINDFSSLFLSLAFQPTVGFSLLSDFPPFCSFFTLLSPPSYSHYLQMSLTLRRLMSYIYGAPILDVSRSHTTTQHSR